MKSSAFARQDSNSRQVYFGRDYGLLNTAIRSRRNIGEPQNGPVIIEEPDTTVVVPPGWSISSDAYTNLTLTKL